MATLDIDSKNQEVEKKKFKEMGIAYVGKPENRTICHPYW